MGIRVSDVGMVQLGHTTGKDGNRIYSTTLVSHYNMFCWLIGPRRSFMWYVGVNKREIWYEIASKAKKKYSWLNIFVVFLLFITCFNCWIVPLFFEKYALHAIYGYITCQKWNKIHFLQDEGFNICNIKARIQNICIMHWYNLAHQLPLYLWTLSDMHVHQIYYILCSNIYLARYQ